MPDYSAVLELDVPSIADEVADPLIDVLLDHHVALVSTQEDRVAAHVTFPAHDARQAVATALALAGSTGHGLVALQVLPTADRDARAGLAGRRQWRLAPVNRCP